MYGQAGCKVIGRRIDLGGSSVVYLRFANGDEASASRVAGLFGVAAVWVCVGRLAEA
jgi:hypothetical protein